MASERNAQFSAPTWLRNLGFSSWLLVGFVLIIVGLIWLLAETSTIVMPVILAAVIGAVAGPVVGWLERHRVPRIGARSSSCSGSSPSACSSSVSSSAAYPPTRATSRRRLNQSLDKIQGWLHDLGVDNAQSAKEDVQKAAPEIRTTLLSGVATGI